MILIPQNNCWKNKILYVYGEKAALVSGTSSYSRYREGIEIEIDTRKDCRRKGFPYACGAKLILECRKRNLYPSLDAHNKASAALAEKLGYHYSHACYISKCRAFRIDPVFSHRHPQKNRTFSGNLCIQIFQSYHSEKIAELYSANGALPVYKINYKNTEIAFYRSMVGSPACQ